MNIGSNDALVVVDVQNDFCKGGSLAVSGGDDVIAPINKLIPRFSLVAFTRDWHPPDHCSFSDRPTFTDKSWPAHCIRDTRGAAFHPALDVPDDALVVNKGTEPGREAYSGFDGTDLAAVLRGRAIARVYVCGLATDYCVKATALDALREGFDTIVIRDACRGVDIPLGAAADALDEMQKAGAIVVDSGALR